MPRGGSKVKKSHIERIYANVNFRERVIELKEELREARQVSKAIASLNAPPYKAPELQDKLFHPSTTNQSTKITIPPAPPLAIAIEDEHNDVRFLEEK